MSKKRSNGEGTIIFHKASERYMAQYTKPNGKRGTVYGKTKKEVSQKLTKALAEIQNNTYIETNKIRFIDILKEYVENKYKTNQVISRTYIRDKNTIKQIEKTCQDIVNMPIQKINVHHILAVLPNLTEYSNTSIDKIYRFLKKVFKIAVSNRIITFNPMDSEIISKPISNIEDKKVEALELQEQRKLVQVLKSKEHKYKNILMLQLYTGMRIGEVLALKREDIDIENNVINVSKSLTRNEQDKVIMGNSTKTVNSIRSIPLNDNAKEVVEDIMRKQPYNINGYIFFNNKKNTYITPDEVNHYLKRLNEKEKIANKLHTHMLRHTFATRCVESGMQPKILQKILGHKKIQTTLDIYTSVSKEFCEVENEKITQYLKAQNL